MGKRFFIAFLLVLPFCLSEGQDKAASILDPAAHEMNFERHLWFSTDNAAGMALSPLDNYSVVSAGYRHTEGDFRSLQRGKSENLLTFNTNGAVSLGRTFLWGDFTFRRDGWQDAQYNTNCFFLDPDMPYYVADDRAGDWTRQSYDMSVKAAFPMLWDRVVFGAGASYLAYKGAKQIDPRGVPIGYALEVSPSVAVIIGEGHAIGAVFTYRNMFERSTFSNVQGSNSSPVFLMKGLGFYSSGSVSGTGGISPYFYPGNSFGGSLQYAFSSGDVQVLADLGFYSYRRDAFQNPQTRYRMGTAGKTGCSADFMVMWGSGVRHKLSLEALYTVTKGTEYLQERDQDVNTDPYKVLAELDMSRYRTRRASVTYGIFTGGRDNTYSWYAGVQAGYEGRSETYFTPESVLEYNNAGAALFAKKNFRAGKTCRILVAADAGYRLNLGGEYDYNGPDPDHRVITVFYANEFAVSSADFFKAGLDAVFSVPVRSVAGINIGASFDGMFPTAGGGSRWAVSGILSVLF
ncbi:MAG: hypothetical protein IAB82_06305 [Bacteroidetes bacterium]|uniref:DUF6850 domain-containing protein n=1 Tax=Candidatus Cryptobacteroides faecavium TaxID=2840762 RepID=A0A9D9NF68_9BACT|nr:hypothetical protein [Candidatus Cryptobacteroides faecavium]